MISVKDRLFHLSTAHTSYVFRVEPAGHLEHLHYGAKTTLNGQAEQALKQKHSSLPSATICYAPAYPNLSMELLPLERETAGIPLSKWSLPTDPTPVISSLIPLKSLPPRLYFQDFPLPCRQLSVRPTH